MNDYSQGICENGAAILKDGLPMTIEQILIELRGAQQLSAVVPEWKTRAIWFEEECDKKTEQKDRLQTKIAKLEASAQDGGEPLFIRVAEKIGEPGFDFVEIETAEGVSVSIEDIQDREFRLLGPLYRQPLSAVTTEAWVLRQKADAIDEASRMCMPSRWGNIDLAPKGFQEYCDGVKSVCAYADSLRAYANKLEKL
jgi:hypothetical protein